MGYKFQANTQYSVGILKNCNSTKQTLTLKRKCSDLQSYTLPILKDVVSTAKTAAFWNTTDNDVILGQFLLTVHGVLRTNIEFLTAPKPAYYPGGLPNFENSAENC